MKIFEYNPITAQVGDLIREVTSTSVWRGETAVNAINRGLIELFDCMIHGSSEVSKWEVYIDAGGDYFEEGCSSYLEDRWICFCIGRDNTLKSKTWQWVILPPKDLLKHLDKPN